MAVTRYGALATLNANTANTSVTLPSGLTSTMVGLLQIIYNPASGAPVSPSGWTKVGSTVVVSASMEVQVWYKNLSSSDSGTSVGFGTLTAAKRGVFFQAYDGVDRTVAPLIASNTILTNGTIANPSVSVSGSSVAISSWFERSSAPSTAVTSPPGFSTIGSIFGTGGGAVSFAVADNLTANATTVGNGGNWVANTASSGAASVTVALRALATSSNPAYDHFVLRSGGVTTELEVVRRVGGTTTILDVLLADAPTPPDLIDAMTTFRVAAHRGGYDNPAPMNTMACFRLGAEQCGIIEMDVQPLSDGTLVTWHDDSVDVQSANGETGLVISKDRDFWNSLMVKPSTVGGGSAQPASYFAIEHPTKPDQSGVIPEFGGTEVILFPESKDPTVDVPLVNAIVAAGLEGQTVLQSFQYSSAQYFAAQGLHSMFLTNAPNAATIAADGIEFVGVADASITQTIIDNCHAQGLKVWVYTVNNVARRDVLIGMGIDGLITNKPYLLAP